MTTYLLDANVLIALVVTGHEHHARARAWVRGIDRFAICPIVEGALVRSLVRLGEHPRVAADLLSRVHAMARCEFWSDSLSYKDVSLRHVQGHSQVTDAYLAGLARSKGGLLATFDPGLSATLRDRAFLVPPR